MLKLVSNNKVMTALAILVAVLGIVQSIVYKDFSWFQRSGALMVGIGIVLLSRTTITGQGLLLEIGSAETSENVNSLNHFQKLNQPAPDYVKNDIESRIAIEFIGPLISFIGTIIWGYGDLLNLLIKK